MYFLDLDGDVMPQVEKRRFEYYSGGSHKYWEIWKYDNTCFTTHWGRIGTKGQTKDKTFASTWARNDAYNKIIAQKKKKGYTEVNIASLQPKKPHINLKPVVKVVSKKKKDKNSPKISMPKVGKPEPADHDNIIPLEEHEDPFFDHLDNLDLE